MVADFLRMGSLPRMDRGVLPHSSYSATDAESLVITLIKDSQCDHADFLRVGSLPRMDRGVLPHSLHAADSRAKKGGAAAELKEMLAAATCPHEAAVIRCVCPKHVIDLAQRKRLQS